MGQEISIHDSLDIQFKGGDLKEALQEISNSSGFRFGYRERTIKGKKVEAIHLKSTLEHVLNKILFANRLCYTVQQKQIIIHTACLPKYYSVSGYIIEDSSYSTLPYISVSLAGKPVGVIADQEGYFELDIPLGGQKTDTLIFSSLGYFRDTIILAAGIDHQHTQVMRTKTYKVPEVLVRPRIYSEQRLGNTKDRPLGSLYLDTHGQQTALRIYSTESDTGIVESVEYYLSKKGNTDAPFRVRIYEVDSNGMPGNDLVEDAVVVKPTIEGGWYSIDISMLEIMMPPEGLFFSMQGVFPDEHENYYAGSDFIDLSNPNDEKTNNRSLIYGQRLGYNKKGKKDTWHYSMNKVWFQLDRQSFGVMISTVVKYEKKNEKIKNSKDE